LPHLQIILKVNKYSFLIREFVAKKATNSRMFHINNSIYLIRQELSTGRLAQGVEMMPD